MSGILSISIAGGSARWLAAACVACFCLWFAPAGAAAVPAVTTEANEYRMATLGPLRIDLLDRPQLVVTGSGGMARLRLHFAGPIRRAVTVRLTIDDPTVATFKFGTSARETVCTWTVREGEESRFVDIAGVANAVEPARSFSVRLELEDGMLKHSAVLPGMLLSGISRNCFPDSVRPAQGAFSNPYGSDCLRYEWVIERTETPCALTVRSMEGSVTFGSIDGAPLGAVKPEETGRWEFSLPRDRVTPIYLDSYADTPFGLRHRRYEIAAYHSGWREVARSAAFSPRDGAAAVEFRGKFWLVGGWNGTTVTSEVWNSDDGKTWHQVAATAPWPARHGGGVVVFRDRIWIVSGEGHADVWNSRDGVHWNRVTEAAPWGRRYTPSVAVFSGKLWLMGGQWWSDAAFSASGVIGYNDVWSSEDGIEWSRVTAAAPWSPRSLVHGSVVHDGRLWIVGGGLKGSVEGTSKTLAEFNDVWSSPDGRDWTLVTASAPWKPRTHFSVAAFDGRIWLTDGSVGTQDEQGSEVWTSRDGEHWVPEAMVPWPGRHASSLAVFKGTLWLIAGRLYCDVWRYDLR